MLNIDASICLDCNFSTYSLTPKFCPIKRIFIFQCSLLAVCSCYGGDAQQLASKQKFLRQERRKRVKKTFQILQLLCAVFSNKKFSVQLTHLWAFLNHSQCSSANPYSCLVGILDHILFYTAKCLRTKIYVKIGR